VRFISSRQAQIDARPSSDNPWNLSLKMEIVYTDEKREKHAIYAHES
jgi:hypothetical protein